MTDSRVRRGRATQELAAEWFRGHGFPKAEAVAASLKGKDIKNLPMLSCEMKATSQADLLGAIRQARRNGEPDDLPFVVYRPDGYGPERIHDWLVGLSFRDFTQLLADAGYGDFDEQ